jgi:hypothetical protein
MPRNLNEIVRPGIGMQWANKESGEAVWLKDVKTGLIRAPKECSADWDSNLF